jgi:polyphenol oxidase
MKHGVIVLSAIVFLGSSVALGQGCPPNTPVGNCAPKTGTATAFAGDSGPMRTRKSIWALNSAEIKELRLAFQKLRALPSTDPRSWMAQAKVHCWNCSGDASTIADVHGTWAFMPWHRDYLYQIEKILGQLVGNPNFAIPYWDWNTPDAASCVTPGSHRSIPGAYFPKMVGTANNTLWDCYRDETATAQMANGSVGKARVDSILTIRNTFSLFFGGPSTAAALWPGPHGYVHVWTADHTVDFNNPKQDMGVLETAARDPLFWAHHANIDRLWDVWIAQHGTPTYPSGFLNQSWTFWNEKPSPFKLATMTGNDAAQRATRLKYQYAAPSCTPTSPPLLMIELEQQLFRIGPDPETIITTARPTARMFNIAGNSGTHVLLHLDNITVPSDKGAVLRVYLNRPNATAEAPEDDERLVDELFIVPSRSSPSEHGDMHAHPFNFVIPLPEKLAAEVEAAKGEVSVTIVPVRGSGQGPLSLRPSAVDVRMQKPYITVE